MKSIKFKEANRTYRADGCHDLPAYNDGKQTITCWQLSPAEIEYLRENGGKIWLSVLAGPSTPPVCVEVQTPFVEVKHDDAFCEIAYFPIIDAPGGRIEMVWNGIDAPAPKFLVIRGRKYVRDLSFAPRRTMTPVVKTGQYYIRATEPGRERDEIGADSALILVESDGIEGVIPIPEQL